MRQSEAGTNLTLRNQPIRMCIAQNLIQLMASKKLEEITVTELVKKSHVSRMTFYKYFTSKEEVLKDYMFELVNDYIEDIKKYPQVGKVHELTRIQHCLEFFKSYSPLLLTLVRANMYSIIIETVNNYMDTYVVPVSQYTQYELYYYAGALTNVFLKWLESGMVEAPEKIAEMVYKHWN